jgi:hypothetical protein
LAVIGCMQAQKRWPIEAEQETAASPLQGLERCSQEEGSIAEGVPGRAQSAVPHFAEGKAHARPDPFPNTKA